MTTTAALITAAVSLVAAIGLVLERATGFLTARKAAKAASADTAAAVASAAATLAGSVEDLLAPLQAEVRELRAEVRALRAVLIANGIPLPQPPFIPEG